MSSELLLHRNNQLYKKLEKFFLIQYNYNIYHYLGHNVEQKATNEYATIQHGSTIINI